MRGVKGIATLASALLLLGTLCFYVSAEKIVFYESFTEDPFTGDRWVVSKSTDYGGTWSHSAPEDTGDSGLLVSEKAKKYGIAASLPDPVDPKAGTLVVQYDLRLQEGIECGGAYLKFLMPQEAGWTPDQLKDDSPYSIMFGPDKCGTTNKVHFIFRHKSPKTGEYVEHHLSSPPMPETDKLSHVYTAVIYPNNTLKLLIDGEEKTSADLLSDDFQPPVLPPETIPDKDDKKPEDWDERAKIADPEAKKPEDWDEDAPRIIDDMDAVKPDGWLDDEPQETDDPDATKPEDWDDEEDGEWEPSKVPNPKCEAAPGCGEWKRPTKKNPAYRGKWSAPLIDNPAYKGKWKPRDIPNPEYFHLDRPNLEPVAAVGIEIWTMNDGFVFDNILVTDDEEKAAEFRETTWKPKFEKESAAVKAKEDEEAKKAKKDKPAAKSKGPKEQVFEALYKIAHLPLLKPVKEQLLNALDFLESKDEYAYATIAALFALFAATFYFLLPSKKKTKRVAVETAKKEDISEPDDVAAEGDSTEPESTVEEEKPADKETEPAAEGAAESEPAEEPAEVEGETEGTARRRSRRQT